MIGCKTLSSIVMRHERPLMPSGFELAKWTRSCILKAIQADYKCSLRGGAGSSSRNAKGRLLYGEDPSIHAASVNVLLLGRP